MFFYSKYLPEKILIVYYAQNDDRTRPDALVVFLSQKMGILGHFSKIIQYW